MKDGLLDWDCAESIDVPTMAEALSYIRQHASFPVSHNFIFSPYVHIIYHYSQLTGLTNHHQPTLDSKEDQNSVGKCPVPATTISALKSKVSSLLPSTHPLSTSALNLCLLDGFLLYSPSMSAIQPHLDIKIFLRASYAKAKARREARDGYVTLEGFWADPPGYVDKIVWPNYVAEHSWMFQSGDVEGEYEADVLEREAIRVPNDKNVDGDMDKILEWMVDLILEELKEHA